MPVLPLGTYVFPEDLLEWDSPKDDQEQRWFVIQTRSRAEKVVARWLELFRTPFYLPLYSHKFYHKNRLLTSWKPLFPGYVFLRCDELHTWDLFYQVEHVIRVLRVPKQRELHQRLVDVHRVLQAGVPVVPEHKLQVGQWVEVKTGPLRGLEGKIVRVDKGFKFVIEIDFLKRGISCEISGWELRPLGGPPPHLAASENGKRRRRRRRRRRKSSKHGGNGQQTDMGIIMP